MVYRTTMVYFLIKEKVKKNKMNIEVPIFVGKTSLA